MGLLVGTLATPDGTIKYGQMDWQIINLRFFGRLCLHLQADPERRTKESMAHRSGGACQKCCGLTKLTGVLRTKKPPIIETVNGLPKAGGGLPPELTDNWDDIVGLLDILTKGKMRIWIGYKPKFG